VIQILELPEVDLGLCAEKLKLRLRGTDGVRQADVNSAGHRVYIEFDPAKVSIEELKILVAATTLSFNQLRAMPVLTGKK
jgi:copper chaperone CopZ